MSKSIWIAATASVAFFLLGSSAIKFAEGFREDYSIPVTVFYAAAAVELVGGLLLLTRRWRLGCCVAIGLSVGGMVTAWFMPTKSCGCHGSLSPESWQFRVLVSATLGAVACALCARDDSWRYRGLRPGSCSALARR